MHFYGVCSILVRLWRQYSNIKGLMSTIPDFTESQIWAVTSALKERFKDEVQEIDEYDDLADCRVSLLRAQADHVLKQEEEAGNV